MDACAEGDVQTARCDVEVEAHLFPSALSGPTQTGRHLCHGYRPQLISKLQHAVQHEKRGWILDLRSLV